MPLRGILIIFENKIVLFSFVTWCKVEKKNYISSNYWQFFIVFSANSALYCILKRINILSSRFDKFIDHGDDESGSVEIRETFA